MGIEELRKYPVVLSLIGVMLIIGILICAVWLITKSQSSPISTTGSQDALPVVSNDGSPDNLQAVPVPIQSGGTLDSQMMSNGASWLQPQQGLTPQQLQNLQ